MALEVTACGEGCFCDMGGRELPVLGRIIIGSKSAEMDSSNLCGKLLTL